MRSPINQRLITFGLQGINRVKGDGFGWTYPEQGGQYTDDIANDLREKMDTIMVI